MRAKKVSCSLLGIFFLLAFLAGGSVIAAEIGYVDYEFLFIAHPEYPSKNLEFQSAVEGYNDEYLAAIEDATSEEELVEIYEHYNALFQTVENELSTYILKSVNKHIGEVAQAESISIVLANTVVLYGGTDLTKLVVEAMYRTYGISVPSYLDI